MLYSIDNTIDNTFTCVRIEHTFSLECIRYGSMGGWVGFILTSLQSFKPSKPNFSMHPIPYHIYDTTHRHLWSRMIQLSPLPPLLIRSRSRIFCGHFIHYLKRKQKEKQDIWTGVHQNKTAEAGFELGTFQSRDDRSTVTLRLFW